MRRLNSKLTVNFISEKGNDPVEKTYVAYTPLENYMCIAVAESYDNDMEENSARLAVEAILSAFARRPSLKRIHEYIRYANSQIRLHSTRKRLKVSISVIVTDYTRMRYGVCGNTRLFEFFENLITLTSKTHTRYQQFLDDDAGKNLDFSEIHNLTRYLGQEGRVKPFVSKSINLTEGSSLLLSTSNLWGRLSDVEILDAWQNAKTGEEFLDSLQELLLSLQDQETQKIGSFTVAAILVEKTYKEDVQKERKKKRRIMIAAGVVIAVVLIFFIAVLVIRAGDRRMINEIREHDQRGIRYICYENYTKAQEEYEQAAELADGLILYNWQYIREKKELIGTISDRSVLLSMLQEGEAALAGKNYGQAEKLYTQIQKDATYQDFDTLADDAAEKLKEIRLRMQISQLAALGDMYASTEDYDEALEYYEKALDLLGEAFDLETQGAIRAKVYDILQKQKEERQAEAETKQEQEEEAKQKAADKAVVKVNALIASANNALDEGRIARAKKLYRQALSAYKNFPGSGEDADKIYGDITALGQAITEAEAKAEEDALAAQLALADKYILQAKEAAKKGDPPKAEKLYRKALKIYKELDIWDERTEELYEAIDALG